MGNIKMTSKKNIATTNKKHCDDKWELSQDKKRNVEMTNTIYCDDKLEMLR